MSLIIGSDYSTQPFFLVFNTNKLHKIEPPPYTHFFKIYLAKENPLNFNECMCWPISHSGGSA